MKSSDLATWTPVLKFQNIAGPIECAAGTVQREACVAERWCTMRHQFGIVADPTACPALTDGAPIDDATMNKPPGSGGCCDANSGASIGVAWIFILAMWPRSRRSR
jgi:hypothetical protein